MNKTELVDAIAEKSGLTKKDAAAALDAVLDSVTATLAAGDAVTLTGFGSFGVRARAARTGRNPATGQTLEIAASKVPAFKPGKSLKDAVNP